MISVTIYRDPKIFAQLLGHPGAVALSQLVSGLRRIVAEEMFAPEQGSFSLDSVEVDVRDGSWTGSGFCSPFSIEVYAADSPALRTSLSVRQRRITDRIRDLPVVREPDFRRLVEHFRAINARPPSVTVRLAPTATGSLF